MHGGGEDPGPRTNGGLREDPGPRTNGTADCGLSEEEDKGRTRRTEDERWSEILLVRRLSSFLT
jgi:hypothetical protein